MVFPPQNFIHQVSKLKSNSKNYKVSSHFDKFKPFRIKKKKAKLVHMCGNLFVSFQSDSFDDNDLVDGEISSLKIVINIQ